MISKEDIQNLAQLARLKLNEKEVTGLQKDISSILDYVSQVKGVSGAKGGTSYSALKNVMREDTVRAENNPLSGKEEALRTAFPKREGNFNVVRKIIEKDA